MRETPNDSFHMCFSELTAKYAKYANKMQFNLILFAYFACFAVMNSDPCEHTVRIGDYVHRWPV